MPSGLYIVVMITGIHFSQDIFAISTVLASGKLTIRVRPFNGTRQATHASTGYQGTGQLLLFWETPDLCWSN